MGFCSLVIIAIFSSLIGIISSSTSTCSAIDAYIQVSSSSSNLSTTLTSSQALFAPHKYYIPFTKLIVLDSSIDNICDTSGIQTNISNKIVLLFESHGNCSSHWKVYVAEKNHASAVIIANNEISGEVISIIDDEYVTTTIPMRSIPYSDGIFLSDQIISGETVSAEFGCFDSKYPAAICLTDSLGDYWYLDGDYQRQADIKYNDHPVYMKEGYVWILDDIYIFLHDADGNSDWYWAITNDPKFETDSSIIVRCAVGGLSEPSLCPQWNGTDAYYTGIFMEYKQLNVTSGLCSVSDSYLCISSKQSNLAGLDGTYRQFNSQTPYWFREINDCDTRPGWFYFYEGAFWLIEAYNFWFDATCHLDEKYDNSTWDTVKYLPNTCTNWQTIVNGSLDTDRLDWDDTFQILYSQCKQSTCIETPAPDTICLDKNSIMHGFLEGEYDKTGVIGPIAETPEYQRSEALLYDTTEINIYIWWYGEVSLETKYRWWVISSSSLTQAIEQNGSVSIYGYCEAETSNPLDCKSNWSFYFGYGFYSDDEFVMEAGECVEPTTYEPRVWPEYVCIGLYNETKGSDSDYLSAAYFVGGYAINRTGTKLSEGFPHWVKPYHDYGSDSEVYLYYDGFYGWWQIGDGLHVDDGVQLICFLEDGYSPIDCIEWYDYYNTEMINMYLYECTADDLLTASPTPQPTDIPDSICLSGSSIMQDFLEGKYTQTGIYGDQYGTPEFAPNEAKMYDGNTLSIYIWYYGEIGNADDAQKWVISSYSYTKGKNSKNIVPLYGYCQGAFNSPEECTSCWQFYYQGEHYEDCEFKVSIDVDECGNDDTDKGVVWSEYVCVSVDDDVEANFNLNTIIGGYILNETYKRLSSDKPFYYKPVNDYTKKEQYIWYDEFYNYWNIGPEIYVNATIQCQQDEYEHTPSQCETWYDISSTSMVLKNFKVSSIGCDENDVLTSSDEENKINGRVVDILLIVLLIMIVIVACIGLGWYFKNKKDKDRKANIGIAVPQDGVEQIEMNDTAQMTNDDGNATKGGMDMSPLNTNDEDILPNDDGDDDVTK